MQIDNSVLPKAPLWADRETAHPARMIAELIGCTSPGQEGSLAANRTTRGYLAVAHRGQHYRCLPHLSHAAPGQPQDNENAYLWHIRQCLEDNAGSPSIARRHRRCGGSVSLR
jgi:hypothetical protein